MKRLFSIAFLTCSLVAGKAPAVEHWVLVDDHSRPLPGAPPTGWFYNCCGGDRGLLRDITDPLGSGVAAYSVPSPGVYRGQCTRLIGSDLWEFMGFWYALGRGNSQHHQFSPAAVFHPLIRPEFQAKLKSVELVVPRIVSPHGRSDLTLAVELKGWDDAGNSVVRARREVVGRSTLRSGHFPRTFTFDFDPDALASVKIGEITVLLDRVNPGDAIDIDRVRLLVDAPAVAPEIEPLVWSLAMLLENHDETTGMVQDRSNFPNGDFENVTATGKLEEKDGKQMLTVSKLEAAK